MDISDVLGMVRDMAGAAGAPASVEATGSVAALHVVVRDVDTYQAWCAALGVNPGLVVRDTLGDVARCRADVDGWAVYLVCQVLPGDLLVVSGG